MITPPLKEALISERLEKAHFHKRIPSASGQDPTWPNKTRHSIQFYQSNLWPRRLRLIETSKKHTPKVPRLLFARPSPLSLVRVGAAACKWEAPFTACAEFEALVTEGACAVLIVVLYRTNARVDRCDGGLERIFFQYVLKLDLFVTRPINAAWLKRTSDPFDDKSVSHDSCWSL